MSVNYAEAADAQGGDRRRRYPLAKVKGGWTQEEDCALKRLVEELGEGNWSIIARNLNDALGKDADTGRIGKQCRERYNHHLRPNIKKDAWTEHEEELLVQAHLRFGNRWSDIAKVIKGRTENAVKNHWNAALRRKDNERFTCGKGVHSVLKNYMVSISLLPGYPSPSPSHPAHHTAHSGNEGQVASTSSTPAAPPNASPQVEHSGRSGKRPAPAGPRVRAAALTHVGEGCTDTDVHRQSPCSSQSFAGESLHGAAAAVVTAADITSQALRKRPRIIVIPSIRPARTGQRELRKPTVPAVQATPEHHGRGSDSADESQYADPRVAQACADAEDSDMQAAQIMMALKSVSGGGMV